MQPTRIVSVQTAAPSPPTPKSASDEDRRAYYDAWRLFSQKRQRHAELHGVALVPIARAAGLRLAVLKTLVALLEVTDDAHRDVWTVDVYHAEQDLPALSGMSPGRAYCTFITKGIPAIRSPTFRHVYELRSAS